MDGITDSMDMSLCKLQETVEEMLLKLQTSVRVRGNSPGGVGREHSLAGSFLLLLDVN